MMQHVADGFTALAVLTGLWAALLWRQSARVAIDPGPGCVSGIQDVQDRSWVMALLGAALEGGKLDSRAAT